MSDGKKENTGPTFNIPVWLKYPVFIVFYTLSFLLSAKGQNIFASSLLFLVAITESLLIAREKKTKIDLRILLTLSWLLALSLSFLKLSALQGEWTKSAILSAGGFYFFFLVGFDFIELIIKKKPEKENVTPGGFSEELIKKERIRRAVFAATSIVSFLGVASFLIECVTFDFILPVFSDKPHAYTEFHITGIHYFIVSLFMVPSMSVWYFMENGFKRSPELFVLLILNAFSILIPVLILSKYQLLLTVVIPLVSFIVKQKKLSVKKLLSICIPLGAGLFILFCFIVLERKYPEGYLKGIFEFYNPETPLFIQYPYTYIVNNLENFNLLTKKLTAFSFGKRQLFPLLALTGLKFLPAFRKMLSYEVYTTKPELTTYSVIYDAYGDFGVFGVFAFGMLLGMFVCFVTRRVNRKGSASAYLLFGETAVYCALSFFTTWFSNPTSWFYFIATGAIGLFIYLVGEKGKFIWKK